MHVTGAMSSGSGIARKLLVGFGALVCTFALASYLTLAGLNRIQGVLERVSDEEESVRLALQLASAVRDQYAHQAHTIIIGDESHLGFYSAAERHVLELTRALRARAKGADEQTTMAEIESASAELDRIFRGSIVPAVVRGDRAFVRAEHARAQLVVTRIQDLSEQLVQRFEARIAAARDEAAALERRTRRWLLALLFGAPLVAAAVTFTVGRSIAVPLGRLRAGAARLASGDLDTRIAIDSKDEFGALAEQFNAMTVSLKDHQAKLLQSEKLASVGRLAAGVAHEINNPLGVILGYVRLLRKGRDPELDGDLSVIEDETLRCKEIVDGLLELARPPQAGLERLDLRELCDEVVARLRAAPGSHGLDVTVQGDGRAEGHASKIRQVIANLVRNAAEAAGPGGRVEVVVDGGEASAQVAVHDSGPGIAEQASARLFEPVFTTKPAGTGLGLAVSRAIARAHGGDVEVGSSRLGGALFTLRLPRRA